MQPAAAALSHRPEFASVVVQRNIQGTVVERITATSASCQRVVGRKDAADKANNREAVTRVCTQCINVPPDISAGSNRRIEAKSSATASAANRPEMAAIGTPGPGCVLPPAR